MKIWARVLKKKIKRVRSSTINQVKTHGLGLFISKQICEIHQGEFKILSNNKGTKVIFEFDLDRVL